MQDAFLDQANILELPIVAKASGSAITSGTVNFYLVDKDGTNAGKWYRGADTSWQVVEAIAGVATHRVDFPVQGWSVEIANTVFIYEDQFNCLVRVQ